MHWWIVGLAAAVVLGYAVWTFNRLVGLSKRATRPGAISTCSSSGGGTWFRHWSRRSRDMRITSRARWSMSWRRGGRRCRPASIPDRGQREQNLSAAVSRLFAVAEAYPDLKATQNFQDLQRNLVEIENNIQYARRYYNAVVRDWNTLVESIPSRWIAATAGLRANGPTSSSTTLERAAPGWRSGRSAATGAITDVTAQAQGRAGLKPAGRKPSCQDLAYSRNDSRSWTWLLVAIVAIGWPASPRGAIPAGRSARSTSTLAVRPDAARRRDRVDRRRLRGFQARHLPRDPDSIRGRRCSNMPCGSGCSASTTVPARAIGTAVSYEENRVRIRIGDAARTLRGPVRYRIRYRVERAILWEGTRAWGRDEGNRDHAVLRWNATGTEWGVPIRRSTVTVKLPRELDDSQVSLRRLDRGLRIARTKTSPSGESMPGPSPSRPVRCGPARGSPSR